MEIKYSIDVKIAGWLLIVSLLYGCNKRDIVYAERKTLIESVYASGKIIADGEHFVYAMNNGIVEKKFFHVGDTVKKGQVLYIITTERPSFKVRSKTKDESILNPGAISLSITSAPAVKEKIEIRSEGDRIIYQSNKEPGDAVMAGEPLLLTGDVANHLALLTVDQADIIKISPGQLVLLRSDLSGDTIFEAEVDKLYPLMDEANHTFRVDVKFRKRINPTYIHNSVEGNIIIQKKENALVIPSALLEDGDSLIIISGNQQVKIKVKTGIKGIGFTEVLEGLDEKTPILLRQKK